MQVEETEDYAPYCRTVKYNRDDIGAIKAQINEIHKLAAFNICKHLTYKVSSYNTGYMVKPYNTKRAII